MLSRIEVIEVPVIKEVKTEIKVKDKSEKSNNTVRIIGLVSNTVIGITVLVIVGLLVYLAYILIMRV